MFPIVYGVGIGLGYMVPFYVIWLYFPNEESIINGVFISTMAFGTGIFSMMQAKLFNEKYHPFETDEIYLPHLQDDEHFISCMYI